MIDYNKQATDLLDKLGIKLDVVYLGYRKHFSDDKDSRDVYDMILTRGRRAARFEFGQSIVNSGEWIVKDFNPKFTRVFNSKPEAANYAAKIGNRFKIVKNPNKKAPTAYDLLACITKNDPGTFEDFCSEFGYDEDSRRAEKTYKAVVDEYKQVISLFNDEELEMLQEIQ